MEYMSKEEVLERLLPKTCIDIMHDTFLSFANGRFEQYLRTAQPLPQGNIFGFMPAYLGEWFGAKLITVFPQNHSAGLPSHQGIVLLFDSATGTLRFAADGDAITAVRTGAVSALATDLLANPSASTLALIGAGAQARSHLAAISCVRPLSKVTVWDRSPSATERFARELSSPSLPVVPCATAREAVNGAEIICTVTPSPVPVLESDWVAPGAHINAVGACAAANRELAGELVARARLYCDSIESALAESGDYLIPLKEGLISKEHMLGTLGQLVSGEVSGRRSPEDITIFDALGLAIEDIACAIYLHNSK